MLRTKSENFKQKTGQKLNDLPKVLNDKTPRIISGNKEIVNLQNWEHFKDDLVHESVFISYAHKDRKIFDEVAEFLSPLSKQGIFYDAQIEVGQLWLDRIKNAINNCKIGVLLLSPSFLDSPFILEVELIKLLALAEEKKVELFILLVRDCVYEVYGLQRFQFVNPIDRALKGLGRNKKDIYYKKLANAILKRLSNTTSS